MANDFYVEQGVTSENWTGDSKGFKSVDYGGLFEGLGDAVKMGASAVDNYYQGTIKEQANAAVTKLQDDYGVSSAVATEVGVDSTATPKEIADGAKRLQLLKSAAVAGTLKGSSYWAQAEHISRQLKMRYPGYWEQIDGTMSGILGRKPANALVAELEQERDKAASEAKAAASKSDQERRNALHAARSAGVTDVFIDEARGKRWSTDAINLAVANRQNIQFQQSTESARYDLLKKRGEATEADTIKTMRSELQHKFATSLGDASAVLGKSKEDYEALVGEANKKRAAGEPVDPALEQQIGAAATAYQQANNDIINGVALKYAQDIPAEKLTAEVKLYQDYNKRILSAVTEKDTVVTGHAVDMFNTLKNADAYRFLMTPENDIIRRDATLMGIMPPDVYRDFKAGQAGTPWRTALDRVYVNAMTNKGLLERRPIKEGVKQLKEQNVRAPSTYNNFVTQVLDAATMPKMPAELKENALMSIFGTENIDFLQKEVKAEERIPLFMKITAPDRLKEVKKSFDKGEISVDAFNSVQSWSTYNAMHLIRDQAAEINSINQFRKGLEISFNPETNYVNVKTKPYTPRATSMLGRGIESVSEDWMVSSGRYAVDRVNNIIRNMKTLVEITGEDPNVIIPGMLANSGIVFEVPPTEVGKTGMEETVEKVSTGLSNAIAGTVATVDSMLGSTVDKAIENLQKEPIAVIKPQELRSKISEDLDKALEGTENKSSIKKIIDDIINGLVAGSTVSQ